MFFLRAVSVQQCVCSVMSNSVMPLSAGFSRQEYWSAKKAPFLMSEEPHSDRKPVGGPGDLVAPALLDFPGGSAGKESALAPPR